MKEGRDDCTEEGIYKWIKEREGKKWNKQGKEANRREEGKGKVERKGRK